jgi:hypothetical protein
MRETMPEEKKAFDAWAIVELMGHLQLAGKISEENLFGTVLMRVDVPDEKQESGFYTRYFGGGSIYSLTPCTEEVARAVAAQREQKPSFAYGLPKQLSGAMEADISHNHPDIDGDDEDQPW